MPQSSKIKVDFIVMDGMTLISKEKYKPKDFKGLLEEILPAGQTLSQTSVVYFEGSKDIVENVRQLALTKSGNEKVIEKELPRTVTVQVVLGYSNDSATLYDSYCNYTNTTKGGVHLNAFEQVFCRYMASKTTASMSDAQREKIKILWEDVKYGLCAVVNLSTNAQVGFVGNAKQEVGNEDLMPVIKDIISEELDKFFSENQSILTEMIKGVKTSAKARIEMAKVKSATQKERMTAFKEHEMKNFIPCNNRKKSDFRELIIIEGNSPSSACRSGCDPNTQAFMMFRGVTANAFKCNLAEIMENKEFRDLVTVLRCGIGKNFDIDKLYFDRINIMPDADIDGFGISSSLLAFFYRFMPEIIRAGKLYKIFPPLYQISDKKHPFVANKMEMIELYHEKIKETYKIKPINDSSYFGKNELYEFLSDTYDYSNHLNRTSETSGNINKYLCEKIIAILVLSGHVIDGDHHDDFEKLFDNRKFVMNFMSLIQESFPECVNDGNKIKSAVNGKWNTIRVAPRFVQKCSELIPIYKKYGYLLDVKEKGKHDSTRMTIGEFLDLCNKKLMAEIVHRYKGLGELEADEIRDTALAFDNRVSVQFTMEDVEKELETFRILHSPSKPYLEKRKKMMSDYKIRMEDLDN